VALILGGTGVGVCGAAASRWISDGSLVTVNESFYQMVFFVRKTLEDIETILMNHGEQLLVRISFNIH